MRIPVKSITRSDRCCRARGTDRNWTRVDRKMSWSPAASSTQQRARVLTDVKARRFAPPPLRGADGLDAGSAHARPDWLLPTMLTHTPLHVVVDVPSRMTLFRATADNRTRSAIPKQSDHLSERSDAGLSTARGARFGSTVGVVFASTLLSVPHPAVPDPRIHEDGATL